MLQHDGGSDALHLVYHEQNLAKPVGGRFERMVVKNVE